MCTLCQIYWVYFLDKSHNKNLINFQLLLQLINLFI